MAAKRICPSLSDLRNKTDRQLVALASREIDHSLNLAGRGAFAEAEARRLQAKTFLAVARAADRTRRQIEGRLEQARVAIERARSAPMIVIPSACY
jgi:hypothetical protein